MGIVSKLDRASEAAFEDDLRRHLDAITARDLRTLDETLHDEIVLVTSGGEVVTDRAEFLTRHREWFESTTWSLEVEELHRTVGTDVATCLIQLDYRDTDVREESVLHLTFVLEGDRWLMAEDQNTPIRTS